MSLGDRIKESTTTTGTGTYSLDGTVSTFQTFVTGIEATNGVASPRVYSDIPFTVIQSDSLGNNIDIEISRGTLTAGVGSAKDTLTRDSITFSSNGNTAVSWGAGTKTIVCAPQGKDVGNVPNWQIQKTSDQTSLAQNTYHKVTWDTTVQSYGVTVDLPNDEVDIQKAGVYAVTAHWGWLSLSAHQMRSALYTDGTIEGDYQACIGSSGDYKSTYSGIVTLTAAEVLSMYGYQTSSGSKTLSYASASNIMPVATWSGFWLRD